MSVSAYDEKLFDAACEDIIEKERAKNGIGTLQEKTMHAVLKRFYEPDHTHQEIRINGYVADIFRDNEIIEIQTGSFNAMRKKIRYVSGRISGNNRVSDHSYQMAVLDQ